MTSRDFEELTGLYSVAFVDTNRQFEYNNLLVETYVFGYIHLRP